MLSKGIIGQGLVVVEQGLVFQVEVPIQVLSSRREKNRPKNSAR